MTNLTIWWKWMKWTFNWKCAGASCERKRLRRKKKRKKWQNRKRDLRNGKKNLWRHGLTIDHILLFLFTPLPLGVQCGSANVTCNCFRAFLPLAKCNLMSDWSDRCMWLLKSSRIQFRNSLLSDVFSMSRSVRFRSRYRVITCRLKINCFKWMFKLVNVLKTMYPVRVLPEKVKAPCPCAGTRRRGKGEMLEMWWRFGEGRANRWFDADGAVARQAGLAVNLLPLVQKEKPKGTCGTRNTANTHTLSLSLSLSFPFCSSRTLYSGVLPSLHRNSQQHE